MCEHSMVASDDAIKVIGLVYENNMDQISQEIMWQLEELIRIVNSNT